MTPGDNHLGLNGFCNISGIIDNCDWLYRLLDDLEVVFRG